MSGRKAERVSGKRDVFCHVANLIWYYTQTAEAWMRYAIGRLQDAFLSEAGRIWT